VDVHCNRSSIVVGYRPVHAAKHSKVEIDFTYRSWRNRREFQMVQHSLTRQQISST